jgi:hypothetical protein
MEREGTRSVKKMKNIVVGGATGLLGTALVEKLHEEGHRLILVGRNPQKLRDSFSFSPEALTWEEFSDYDAKNIDVIVNLAGASVGDKRWSPAYKKVMRDSRIDTTRACVEISKRHPNIHLINASAVSAYGFYPHDHFEFAEGDEDKRTGESFLQDMIDDWEATALKATDHGVRVTLLRFGVVLDRFGGAMPIMMNPYSYYVGGPIGSGKQIMSWIGVRDAVNAMSFLIERGDIVGPVNLVSPGPCTQKEFATALGKALKKPSAVTLPAPIARAMMGQFGQELVLTGQRVRPEVLLQNGFEFQYTEISEFLAGLFAPAYSQSR